MRRTLALLRAVIALDTVPRAWDPCLWHDYANDDCAADTKVFDDVSTSLSLITYRFLVFTCRILGERPATPPPGH